MARPIVTALIILLGLARSFALSDELSSHELPAKEAFYLFLLVGQSNMAGRGEVTEEDRQPLPRVKMLNKENQWVPAVAPLHFDKPSAGVGLGRSFGIALSEANPNITIGLIPCAAGGSPLSSWQPGGYHGQTKSHPYDDTLTRAKKGLEAGTLKAILWHQGESDCKPERAAVYEAQMHELVTLLRKDLAAQEVPFIAGQMGQFEERPWNDSKRLVDRVHRELPSKLSNCAFVNSDELSHRGDNVHFSAEAYREFGRRYAAAYFKLQEPDDSN